MQQIECLKSKRLRHAHAWLAGDGGGRGSGTAAPHHSRALHLHALPQLSFAGPVRVCRLQGSTAEGVPALPPFNPRAFK